MFPPSLIYKTTPERTRASLLFPLLATHAVGGALLLEMRLALLCQCFRAFAYLFSFEQQQVSLSLSRFVSFSAAAAGAAWLFGDACLFLSSFAPCDDGPAKFCPCFKNCSVLNFLLFGFIIRTRTHTHTHVQARVHTFRSRRNYKFHVVVVDLAIFLKLLFIKHRSIRFYIAMTAANLRL